MAEKIKITKSELNDLYDITDEEQAQSAVDVIEEKDVANATVEEYTEYIDEKKLKEDLEDGS